MANFIPKLFHNKLSTGVASTLGAIPHKFTADKHFALEKYFTGELVYFYAFPAGEDSQFYNQVSPFEEELVSGRPLVAAGDGTKVLTFAASSSSYVLDALSKGVEVLNEKNIIRLPEEISSDKTGSVRNELIKKALVDLVDDDQLVMAQPFLDKSLEKKFKIHPLLSVGLNDKRNKHIYIPDEYLPQKYAIFSNGKEFYQYSKSYPFPCVVKVTSSSSGDGVVICKSTKEMKEVKNLFAKLKGNIIVEEFIESIHNIGVQIGIPFNREMKPEIIGFNEQVISNQGEFLGGIVNATKHISYFDDVKEALISEIFPRIRSYGWYGIGGIDVLITKEGKFYFIDPNFRMTAMSTYIYLSKINKITMPTISFSGKIACSRSTFENTVLPLTKGNDSPLKMISLTEHSNTFRFNAGIQFDSIDDLKKKVNKLRTMGVTSTVLTKILESSFDYKIN